jgi:hypothetical protein
MSTLAHPGANVMITNFSDFSSKKIGAFLSKNNVMIHNLAVLREKSANFFDENIL